MQNLIVLVTFLLLGTKIYGQNFDAKKVQPDSTTYSNICVKKVAESNEQSTFIIWVKKGVKPHYHATHTEYVSIVSGKGKMTLDGKTFAVKRGQSFVIQKGIIHSVETTSRKPLKVISVQAPKFDGDRVMVE
jgi:mannose-6-phosphate isomerase-like protein (cupin superfamily)